MKPTYNTSTHARLMHALKLLHSPERVTDAERAEHERLVAEQRRRDHDRTSPQAALPLAPK